MSTNRLLGIVLLVAGLIFLFFGLQATDSFSEEVRENLTGKYTDKTTWYIVGGATAAIVGAFLAFFNGRARIA